jgi:myosin-1
MNLTKGDEVEIKEKDDNGWWMVVKDGQEGWAPSNYLKLIEQPAAPPPPPAPVSRPTPAATKPAAAPVGGGAAAAASAIAAMINGGQMGTTPSASSPASSTPNTSRPGSVAGRAPPAINKPKPVIPPKPGAKPAIGGAKPPIPAGYKAAPPAPSAPGQVNRPAAAGGQMDLAAALRKRAQQIHDE